MHGRGRSRKPQMGADAGLRQVEGGMPAVHESSSCPSRQLHSPGSASSGSMLRTHARTSWRQTPAAAVPPPRRPAPPHQSALHRQTHSTAQHSTAQHAQQGGRQVSADASMVPSQPMRRWRCRLHAHSSHMGRQAGQHTSVEGRLVGRLLEYLALQQSREAWPEAGGLCECPGSRLWGQRCAGAGPHTFGMHALMAAAAAPVERAAAAAAEPETAPAERLHDTPPACC